MLPRQARDSTDVSLIEGVNNPDKERRTELVGRKHPYPFYVLEGTWKDRSDGIMKYKSRFIYNAAFVFYNVAQQVEELYINIFYFGYRSSFLVRDARSFSLSTYLDTAACLSLFSLISTSAKVKAIKGSR